jgi:DNA (cytosine-5)-methyltransferase 1
MKPKLIDLFAGGGGFTLGGYQAGFTPALAVDNDSDLSHNFPVNFPLSTVLAADIAGVDPRDILNHAGINRNEAFGIVGGPPCQGFSAIGKRDVDDSRNALVLEYFRFVRNLEPAFFVMENVLGIVADPFAKILDRGLDSVSSKYDFVGPLSLNAADFGAATSRTRTIVIGYRTEYVNRFSEKNIEMLWTNRRSVYDAIHDLPSPDSVIKDELGILWAKYNYPPAEGARGDFARAARLSPPRGVSVPWVREAHRKGLITGLDPTVHTSAVIQRFAKTREGERESISRCPRLMWGKPSPTLRAGTGKDHGSHQAIRPLHPTEHRVITVREAARIQGFPDWYQFHPTKWHSFRMIGNSVSPIFAAALLALVRKHMIDEK